MADSLATAFIVAGSDGKPVGFRYVSTLPTPRLVDLNSPNISSHDIRARPIDFNNDGLMDVLIFSYVYGASNGTSHLSEIQFFRNAGNGIFFDVTSEYLVGYDASGYVSYNPQIADFNADGKLDIFSSSQDWFTTPNSTTLLLAQDNGTYVDTARSYFSSLLPANGGQISLIHRPNNQLYALIESQTYGGGASVSLSKISFVASTYSVSISSIQSIGLSPDGQNLLVRVDDVTQSVPLGSSINFNGNTVTTTELTNTITPVQAFTDNANNGYKLPTVYSGPVGFLQYQLFDNSDGAVITAPVGTNDFIYLSSTNTAANKATNGNGGQDVIAGGVGSSFIAGGTNHNSTFFLDGRASGVSWSTITDFNIGTDNLTIFGWNPSNSSLNTSNPVINGAVGYTGLTLYMNNLAPDGSAANYVNSALNQITLANHTLAEFGYNSVAALNTALQTLSTEAINNSGADIIASHTASNGHFTVGQTTDNVGTGIHWYLNVH